MTSDDEQRATPGIRQLIFDPATMSHADYKDLKAEAAKRGVPLAIKDNRPAPKPPSASTVEQFDDQRGGVRYVNRTLIQRYSVVRLDNLARRDGLRLQVFNSRDDLNADAQRLHDAAAGGVNA